MLDDALHRPGRIQFPEPRTGRDLRLLGMLGAAVGVVGAGFCRVAFGISGHCCWWLASPIFSSLPLCILGNGAKCEENGVCVLSRV